MNGKIIPSVKVGGILTDRKVYEVPIFQRSFAWEEQQVLDLWEDLIAVYEGKTEEHFLGSMVFTELENNRVRILDGQQRLATILLFLAALRDELRVREDKIKQASERINLINEILYTQDLVSLAKSAKLQLNREDRVFFEKIIVEGIIPEERYTSHKLIKKAYELLRDRIKKYIDKDGEIFVRNILDIILNKLIMIKIIVDSDVNAHIIFETLNDRGLDLSVADLVKNYLFSIAGNYLGTAMDRWKEIVDNVGDHNVSKFLRHFWISKYELVRKEELYKKLKEKVNARNVREFLESLSKEAEVYSNLSAPSHEFWGDSTIENMLKELNVLKVEQAYVLLLAAYDKYYRVNKENFRMLLKDVINFTFRWSTICGLNPNEMERRYSELAIKLRNDEITMDEIRGKLRELAPDDKIFEENFKNKKIKSNKLAKYILLKINNYMLKKEGEKELTVDIGRVNLEHVIPKNPDSEWHEFFRHRGIENYKEFIYNLGNMTILLKEYNRRIANKFFTKKKKMYEKSRLPLNKKLKEYEEFGPKQIEERVIEMCEVAKKIWGL